MTNEQMRMKIAEACGWAFVKGPRYNMLSTIPAWHITSPNGETKCGKDVWLNTGHGKDCVYSPFQGELSDYLDECAVPDYLNDRNAIYEALNAMTDCQWVRFTQILSGEVDVDNSQWPTCFLQLGEVIDLMKTPTDQLAEAFLRTLSLWENQIHS